MTSLSAFVLGTKSQITAALTDSIITDGVSSGGVAQAFWGGFDGINALTVEADFGWASGGTTAILRIDTAQGSGAPWRNVMRFDFAMAVRAVGKTIVRGAVETALDDLGAEGLRHYLGDRFRARLTTTGTYAGGTLITVRATPSK
jgi:hypothetical protein